MATQRGTASDRLLGAVVDFTADRGYAELTVERLIARAGVSRPTFYQHFTSVEDCFICACNTHAQRLLDETRAAVRRDACELSALDPLARMALDSPSATLVLSREVLAAGERGLDERAALIAALADLMATAASPGRGIDLPPSVLLGGVFRFLSIQLSTGRFTPELADGVRQWAAAMTRPRPLRWAEELPTAMPTTAQRASRAIPAGRARTARERLLRATAAAVYATGYRQATVAEIAASAGISRRLFYDHFANKREAFVATYESAFAETVSAGTPAFFSTLSWPERVWEGANAFLGFFAAEPALAHLGFVECYALGTSFLGRVTETQLAFTLFLEEGYRQDARTEALPRAFSSLIAASIFEIGFLASRGGAGLYMRRLRPLVVYIALAPFLGADRATRFVVGKLAGDRGAQARPDALDV